jgi:hypothetical protein
VAQPSHFRMGELTRSPVAHDLLSYSHRACEPDLGDVGIA